MARTVVVQGCAESWSSPGYADKARLEQLLRGAIASNLMLVNLRLRERKEKPPTFLQLLKEICIEEEYEASRKQITPVVHSACRQNVEAKQIEIQNLKSEIKELKSLVATAVSIPVQDVPASNEKTPLNAAPSECSSDSEVATLKKTVKTPDPRHESCRGLTNWRDLVPRVTTATKSVVDAEPDPEPELDDSENDNDHESEPVNKNISDLEDDEHTSELEPEGERNEECE